VDHRALIVVADSPAVAPLLDLLHLLHRQRLMEAVLVGISGRPGFVTTAIDPRSADATRFTLDDYLRGPFSEFVVCHLTLADTPNIDGSSELAYQVERAVQDAVAVGSQRAAQTAKFINLAVPAPTPRSMRSSCGLEGDRGLWVNVLLMPEVQERPDLAVAPVRLDEEYVSNAVSGMASVLSLWLGSEGQDGPVTDRFEVAEDLRMWHLVRCRSRTLTAPELPDMVIADLTRTVLLEDDRGDISLEMISPRAADEVAGEIVSVFAEVHGLRAKTPPPAGKREQRVISIREFIGLLVAFVLRIPGRIVEELVSWALMIWGFLLRRLDQLVGTDGLEFRFSRGPGVVKETPDRPEIRHLRSAAADANPELWASLRSLAFALLDGEQMPERFSAAMQQGNRRFIMPDPRYVVRPPEPVDANVSGAAAQPPLPDPATWEGSARGVVDRIVLLMHQEHLKSLEIESNLTAEADEIVRREEEERQRRESAGWFRRFTRRFWRLLKFLFRLGIVVAIIVVPLALPIAGALAISAVVAAQVALAFLLLARLRRMVLGWFRVDHLLPEGLPEVIDLRQRADRAHVQSERLRQHGAIACEWMAIIQSVIYHPYGPPRVTVRNRIRRAELHLPASHKIEDAITSDMRLAGIVDSARRQVFQAGWLHLAYANAVGHAEREHSIRAPGSTFRPDSDRSLPNEPQQAERAILRDALESGRAMRASRQGLARWVHSMLAEGGDLPLEGERLEDWLFTRTAGGAEPSEFLDETFGEQTAGWNRSFLNMMTGLTNAASKVEQIKVVDRASLDIPDLLDPEELDDGIDLEFQPLQFRSAALDVSWNISEDDLSLFSDDPVVVSIDLSEVGDLWRIPPDDDAGEIVEFTDEERDRWGIDDSSLPEAESVIVPRGPVAPAPGRGQYAFMMELGGRPVPLASTRIRYKVRTTAAPPNASEIVRWVLQSTSDVTGLEFEFAGSREDLPGPNERLDHVYLAWAFKHEYERFEVQNGFRPGSSIGLGGPQSEIDGSGLAWIIGGSAVLNSEMAISNEMGVWPNHSIVLLHELGHVLNLDHVPSKREVMHPQLEFDSVNTWGPGDRQGLLLMARGAVGERSAA